MSKKTNYSIPSSSLFKWIITDEEENAVPSIVLTIGDDEPVRSFYVFNINSLTHRACKQLGQKSNKNVLLLFSQDSLSYCSCFAEVVYTLAEQGKEFLHISIPKPLLPSFQATRELIHRDYPIIQYYTTDQQQLGSIYQVCDFTIIDMEVLESTQSMILQVNNELQQCICSSCQQEYISLPIQNQTIELSETNCFYCQLFHCTHCTSKSPVFPIPIPSSLLILPKYHFYWFQSRNPSFPSFCVIHFFEEQQTEPHSILQSFLQMQSCSSCKHSLKPLLFAYIPQQSSYLSSIHSFLSLFDVEKIIEIPYSKQHSDLLKMEMNHLFKLNSSLPIQTPLPSISYTSLYSSFISSQSCHNLSSCYYPLPLTSRDQIKHQLSKEFHSSIQEIDPIEINEIRIKGGSGLVITKTLENQTQYYYIQPHYTSTISLQEYQQKYSYYHQQSLLLTYYNSLFQQFFSLTPSFYIMNCKRYLPIHPVSYYSDQLNQVAAQNLQTQWNTDPSALFEYSSMIETLQKKNMTLPLSNQSILFLGTGGGVPTVQRQNTSILWRLCDNYGILMDCGCNVVNRLVQYLNEEERDIILHRLLLIVISHAHFDHFAYLVHLLLFYQNHPRSFPLPIILPLSLYHYLISLFNNSLITQGILLIPIDETMMNHSIPIAAFTANYPSQEKEQQLKKNIGIRLFHNQHNSQSYSIAFDSVATNQNILLFSGDTLPIMQCFENTSILIHECSFDDDDRNTETKKHTTIKGFVDCYLKCNHRPLFSFLTHFSGRKRVNEETGEKTVGTDERIARRILEEYPELMNEVSIAFDGMIVDLNRQFPSLACELSMLF